MQKQKRILKTVGLAFDQKFLLGQLTIPQNLAFCSTTIELQNLSHYLQVI